MTRIDELGLTKWVKVDGKGHVLGQCLALDRAGALRALPCEPWEAVVSAASHAVGWPKGMLLDPPPLCSYCVTPMAEERRTDGMHIQCRQRWQRAYDARLARAKAQRIRDGKAARRTATIQRGIDHRREKRLAGTSETL